MAAPPALRPPRSRALALVGLSLGFGVVQLDVSAVNVAVRQVGADLGGGVSGLQWMVDAYTLALASLILGAGTLGDRVGAKRVYLFGMAVFTLASAACGLAPDLPALIAFRAVQGIGAAALVPCSLTLLNHAYPEPDERQRAIGLWAAGASVTLAAGPLVGGLLTSGFGWRSIFFINAPLGVLGLILTGRCATDSPRAGDRALDRPGQILAIATLVLLAYGIVEGGREGFGTLEVLACLGAAVVAGTAFISVERRQRRPMLPLPLFRSTTFSATIGMGLLVNVAFYGLIFVLSLYFQSVRGYSALRAGLAFAPMTVAILAANLLTGRILRRLGLQRTLQASSALMVASFLVLLTAGRTSAFGDLVIPLITVGFGLGVLIPAITSAVLGSVERSRSGLAAGSFNAARQTGSVVGVALFGSLASSSIVDGLHASLVVSAALTAVVGALALGVSAAPAAVRPVAPGCPGPPAGG